MYIFHTVTVQDSVFPQTRDKMNGRMDGYVSESNLPSAATALIIMTSHQCGGVRLCVCVGDRMRERESIHRD